MTYIGWYAIKPNKTNPNMFVRVEAVICLVQREGETKWF